MKNQELLKIMDNELLEKLYGFCYARTDNSHDAQDLCSDIILELLKTARKEGNIDNPYPYIWRVAKNIYARYSDKRTAAREKLQDGDFEDMIKNIADDSSEEDDGSAELLKAVYRRIAFLTRAYREVMIMFYLEGLSTAEIAKRQRASETAVRQRLFSARKKIRSEVEEMTDTNNKPVALDKVDFIIWGTGNPVGNDPRTVCTRQFSKHIVHLCGKKPMTAAEIAEELNVPTLYVEEELDILEKGENGEYGLIKKQGGNKYGLNFLLLDKTAVENAWKIYTDRLPDICSIIIDFIEEHKEEYLKIPFLNRNTDFNLILWQQITELTDCFALEVERILSERYFKDIKRINRPFTVYGYEDNGKYYGFGRDNVHASNICGYSDIFLDNIYTARIKRHFHCGLNLAEDMRLQIAVRAIEGLDIDDLREEEKEEAAKAVECGYVYRDGNSLHTKILTIDAKDCGKLAAVSHKLSQGYFDREAEKTAEKMADFIQRNVSKDFIQDWSLVNRLGAMPVADMTAEELIKKDILIPPEDGIGAEGCWLIVSK